MDRNTFWAMVADGVYIGGGVIVLILIIILILILVRRV